MPNHNFDWTAIGPDDPIRWGEPGLYSTSYNATGLQPDRSEVVGQLTPEGTRFWLCIGEDRYVFAAPAGSAGYPAWVRPPDRGYLKAATLAAIAKMKEWYVEGREFRLRVRIVPGRPSDPASHDRRGYVVYNALGKVLRTEWDDERVEQRRAA